MSRSRNDDGRFATKATLEDVIAILIDRDEPVTGKEVGDHLGISNRSALDKLHELHDQGNVACKKVGGSALVWWLTDEQRARGGPVGPLFRLVGLFDDEEAAARARERSEDWARRFDDDLLGDLEGEEDEQ